MHAEIFDLEFVKNSNRYALLNYLSKDWMLVSDAMATAEKNVETGYTKVKLVVTSHLTDYILFYIIQAIVCSWLTMNCRNYKQTGLVYGKAQTTR